MFSFLKKNINKEQELLLLESICSMLPPKFSFLSNQLEDGIVGRIVLNDKPIKGYHMVVYKGDVVAKYERTQEKSYKLTGIKVFNLSRGSYVEICIYIVSNLLAGYHYCTSETVTPDVTRLNITSLSIRYMQELDLSSILTTQELDKIHKNEVYEVELQGRVYYHIKDIGDGDFIAIDVERNIYKITHDPMLITNQSGLLIDLL